MAFKMKGSSLYGKVNLNRGGNASRPDGRAKSSAFQKDVKIGPAESPEAIKKKRQAYNEVPPGKENDAEYDKKRAAYKDAKKYPGATEYKKEGAPKKTDLKDEEKNEWGETPEEYKQRMIDMGLRKSDAKEEIDSKENKKASKRDKAAEKPGAPAIWPFKKKIKGTDTELVKVKKKKARGKKIKTSNNKLRNAFNKTTKKISDKIQEPGKKGNRPGFD